MADYTFSMVLVWDMRGGVVRLARNQRVYINDPATGATAPGLKVDGQPVPYVTSDGDGRAAFTAQIRTVRPVVNGKTLPDATSPDPVAGGGAAEIAYDTDGTPYLI